MKHSYQILGVFLIAVGLVLSAFYLLNREDLLAVGVSAIILGIVSLALARGRPVISRDAWQMFIKAIQENSDAILKHYRLNGQAIYFPEGGTVLIPLDLEGPSAHKAGRETGEHTSSKIQKETNSDAPLEGFDLLWTYGGSPSLAVTTLGNVAIDMLRKKPEPSEDGIKGGVMYILSDILDMARRVAVDIDEPNVCVVITGETSKSEDSILYRIAGSPMASISAAICSAALDKPVRITSERNDQRGRITVLLEVLH